MPLYRVTAVEKITKISYFYKDIEAEDPDEARYIGESEDWTDWIPDVSSDYEDLVDAQIRSVEEL